MLRKIPLIGLLILGSVILTLAQDKSSLNAGALPQTGAAVENFVPAGWEIEETISGDLNNDGVPDAAIKLIEKISADADKENPPSRERILLVLFKAKDGGFERVGMAGNLLQCTGCGGAFYGAMSAPANVEITKGVLIVKEDFGSREVTELTFRFRYDPKVKKFPLIGFDSTDRDRATGLTTTQSTNYLTGAQITEEFQYDTKLDKDVKKSSRTTKISKKTKYLEDIDYEEMTGD